MTLSNILEFSLSINSFGAKILIQNFVADIEFSLSHLSNFRKPSFLLSGVPLLPLGIKFVSPLFWLLPGKAAPSPIPARPVRPEPATPSRPGRAPVAPARPATKGFAFATLPTRLVAEKHL